MIYEVRGLGVAIGGRAIVAGVEFALGPGECVALVGASGSGKSQTCLAPFGLAAGRASGSARLDGVELVGLAERGLRPLRAQACGFVFQQPATALSPHLSIGRQLAEAWRQAGAARPRRSELAAALERVGLGGGGALLDRFPHQLSGGQRQRAMIACAVAHRPRLLVADEPTTALDAALRRDMLALLDRLRAEDGMALLLVSHDLAAVAAHAERIVVLEEGRVVESGAARAIMADPQAPYTRALLAAARPPAAPPTPPAPAPPLLNAEGVRVAFPGGWQRPPLRAVDDASLSIAPGEALALVGRSGSGKSTLANAVARLGPISGGRVSWAGRPLPGRARMRPAQRRLIQPVFQDPVASLDPLWRVADIVAEPLRHLAPELDRSARDARVDALLDEVELGAGYRDRRPAELSGGQAQRIAIARALACAPELLLLDEATSALDVLVAARILALLGRLRDAHGLAILFITHDLVAAARLCHRVAVMEDGRIVEEGPLPAVMANPQADATRRLIAAG